MFLFLLQRTPMEEATERGHKDIAYYLRVDISDVNVWVSAHQREGALYIHKLDTDLVMHKAVSL